MRGEGKRVLLELSAASLGIAWLLLWQCTLSPGLCFDLPSEWLPGALIEQAQMILCYAEIPASQGRHFVQS